jgi:hypothetical protein
LFTQGVAGFCLRGARMKGTPRNIEREAERRNEGKKERK